MNLQSKIKLSFTNPTAPKQFIDVMDKTIDMCNLANLENQNFLVKMLIAEQEKSMKRKFKCPIKKVSGKIFDLGNNSLIRSTIFRYN
jgi:hypothetical protein